MSNTNSKWSALGFHCLVLLCVGSMAARSQIQTSTPTSSGQVQQHLIVDQVEQSLKRCDMTPFSPYICVADSALPDTPVPVASQLPTNLGDFESLFKFQHIKVGDLTVFAPVTMTILSVDFPIPNIYANLQSSDAFTLLVTTLTHGQWDALTSEEGLGPLDLNSDEQRSLWSAALRFPEKVLLHKKGDPYGSGVGVDITDKLNQFTLHLRRSVDVMIPLSDKSYHKLDSADKLSAPNYDIENVPQQATNVGGFVPKQVVPNGPKPSDLDYSDSRFDTPVSLAAVPNLGVLITRIGLATKTELYCDKRMEKFHVSMSPAAGTARAGDILKCIALAVTGTYRRVGPAFILTNDVIGMGTKIALVSDFNQRANTLLRTPLGEAGDKISASHSIWDLPLSSAADLDFSPEEHKEMLAQNPWADSSSSYLTLNMAELTPPQRANVLASANEMVKNPQHYPGGTPNISGKFMLNCTAELDASVPGVDGNISLPDIELWGLFEPSQKSREKRTQTARAAGTNAGGTKNKASVSPAASKLLVDQFRAITSRRAIVVTPTTVAEATETVANAQALGFNQVFINVFSESTAPGAHLTGDISKTGIAMLNAAIKAAHGRGIAVFAYVDLLTWPKDTPSALRDLDIRGEDSAAESVRQQMTWASSSGPHHGPSANDLPMSVSPLNPQVQKVLLSVHQELAEVHGLAGIVWADTATAGYVDNSYNDDEMGYTPPLRLVFVRKEHVDPVDIAPTDVFANVDTTLPIMSMDDSALGNLQRDWLVYRTTGLDRLLRQLRTTVDPPQETAGHNKILLVAERTDHDPGWFGSWDGPLASMPTFHQSREDVPNSVKYPSDVAKQAAMESKISYGELKYSPETDYTGLLRSARELFRTAHWNGVIAYRDVFSMHSGTRTVQIIDNMVHALFPHAPGNTTARSKRASRR